MYFCCVGTREELLVEGQRRISWPAIEEKEEEPDTNAESSVETPNPVLLQRGNRVRNNYDALKLILSLSTSHFVFLFHVSCSTRQAREMRKLSSFRNT